MYGGTVAKSGQDMDRIFEDVQRRLGGLANVTIHRGFSDRVLPTFTDKSLDWIYIDGNHYYDYVRRDLDLAMAKVRSGGFIAGDDYTWGAKEGLPVRRAVQDFLEEHKIRGGVKVIGDQFIFSRP
jgi:predicted O-methyltransferase YrrM